jgi:N-acetylneuraminate synthase
MEAKNVIDSATTEFLSKYLGLDAGQFYLVGEIGVNHNGSLDIAKKLMQLSKNLGLNAVKFQKRTPELCTPPAVREKIRETPWGDMTYLEYRKRIEFSQKEYEEINEYCEKIGIRWSASAWDIESLKFLDQFNLPWHKVASAMNSNFEFLNEVASRGIFTMVSTGMSDFEHIDAVVDVFQSANCPFMLMHTTSTYPAEDSILNVSAIESLRRRYGVPVGYSGHESSVFPSQVAAVLGAQVIERHITLDRTMWGSDQSASLSESGLHELRSSLDRLHQILGDGVKKLELGELEAAKRLRWWL